ncbi:WD40-repeat-containing domain protein [Rhodocollybia butyracea]|uniref:WD40-repeat-containing domain protein n=1 Tax=Rhodocollybia butyracea TaxID=206335 RepID=A0A9P5PV58_9AGAR|nr:WD40-repeat-containing domain protein [Rhodocollybia butyracea]
MSSLKNTRFGKRLRASRSSGPEDENSPRRKRQRLELGLSDSPPRLPLPPPKSPPKSPSKRSKLASTLSSAKTIPFFRRWQKPRYSSELDRNRFVPSLDKNNLRASYSLDENGASSSSKRPDSMLKLPKRHWDPLDPVTDQANDLFKSVLRSEFTASPDSSDPHPGFGRISTYHNQSPLRSSSSHYQSQSESQSRLDDPLDHAYQDSPLQRSTGQLMNQPRPRIREVVKAPYRVLDAPDLPDDFYTNVVDWSPSGILAVALGQSVYLWRSETAEVNKLCSVAGSQEEYRAVAWMNTGSKIAVSGSDLEIYDASTLRLVRRYPKAHAGERMACLSWTSSTLSSGSHDHTIKHWDLRDSSPRAFTESRGHSQEVCGIKWSGDGGLHNSLIASGGNDNRVCVWDLRGATREHGQYQSSFRLNAKTPNSTKTFVRTHGNIQEKSSGVCPLHVFRQHKSAVKGLAWNPHVPGVLASGGGKLDRCIRIWSTTHGTMLNEVDTGSQVCDLLWSTSTNELVSGHGYSTLSFPLQHYPICIWKYNRDSSISLVSSLTGHSASVQYVRLNKNGDTIVTGGADQTLRFWSVFPGKEKVANGGTSVLDFGKLIR